MNQHQLTTIHQTTTATSTTDSSALLCCGQMETFHPLCDSSLIQSPPALPMSTVPPRSRSNSRGLESLLSSSPPNEPSLPQIRDVHSQLPALRIAPLRQPVPRRIWSTAPPFPLKPEITAHPAAATNASAASGGSNLPERLPTLEEFVHAARTSDTDLRSSEGNHLDSNVLPGPPKTILPAFINLQTVENLPYLFEDHNSLSKRRRIDVLGDHFASEHLQLPVPQTQNEKKPPPFGPFAILNGLNEPPPNAALFPPIEPTLPPILTRPTNEPPEFAISEKQTERHADKRELRLAELLDPNSLERPAVDDAEQWRLGQAPINHRNESAGQHSTNKERSLAKFGDTNEPLSPKTRGRSRKNLRKWTEQETTDLLKGVVKCGIGNWTAILQQPELNFNKRSAANLKDRFRVCCPWAYGAADPNEATKQIQDTLANALMKAESLTSGAGGKILLPDPRPKDSTVSTEHVDPTASKLNDALALTRSKQSSSSTSASPYSNSSKSTPNQSLKSKSTLSSLGISEPYFTIKSKRRSRRPFTPAEDEALLKGYAVHGFQWTLIQQDRHLNLSHRRATDLRDRFRTKFPNAYREGGSVSGGNIGSLRRETSNKNKPSPSDNQGRAAPLVKDTQQPISIPPLPPVLPKPPSSTYESTKQPEKKRKSPPESSGLASIGSLLQPPALLGQPSMSLESSGAAATAIGGGGQGLISSFSSNSSLLAAANHNSGSFNSAATNNTSWEDNTLPPLNWDDLN
ncbi:hypothetical protein UA08_01927 [Talaromyces atroroseus]|uniref:Myb-like domain-containing protein n=1 Tax=Talaromyces atroroseus TaxID=1441469 RepID=A0A1Q5QCA1_TALAT|nr:hypothetical protein UA08_01927 [Talaromyces atroroseus]OKL63565.1 hypothetical protein UA08_01927 [Talaromyces atroroseus]